MGEKDGEKYQLKKKKKLEKNPFNIKYQGTDQSQKKHSDACSTSFILHHVELFIFMMLTVKSSEFCPNPPPQLQSSGWSTAVLTLLRVFSQHL